MSTDRLEEFAPVTGEEIRPARGKLLTMLFFFALMAPAGAFMAYCWWYEVELPGGMVLTAKAGIVGLLAVPLALLLTLVMVGLVTSAKRLVLGQDCVQLLKGERVVVHIPYRNVAETYAQGESGAGVVGLRLRDRDDPGTLVPSWTKDRYELQVLTYGKPLEELHHALNQRLAAFRAGHP